MKLNYLALIPVVLAVVMGVPSLWGGFLSGDDIELVRDHVLVNHPSFEHLLKLFAIPHRDLYQPIPLTTFALNFAAIKVLGLEPTVDDPLAGMWVFHLTNVLIHALNAWLVWRVVRGVGGHGAVALLAASLFAVHPLNVEPVAWLNGRMMMLSATFTLAAVIFADRLFERPGIGRALWTMLMVVLAMMSKVSVGLPVLLLLIPLVRRRRPCSLWWVMFALAAAVTGFFVVLNFLLSRSYLDTSGAVLQGSRLTRTVIALGWYISHYLVPVGLGPWHPTEKLITLSHPQFIPSAIAVLGLLVVVVFSVRYWRGGVVGVIWFLATIAVTLPLVPSRNVLAAERYTYLPAIGFHWIIATACVFAFAALRRRGGTKIALPVGVGACVLACVVLLATAWKTTGYYEGNVARFRRTAELYPQYVEVWMRLAWAYYDAGQYEQAVKTADDALERYPESSRGDLWQVQGMALLRCGAVEQALAKLEAAVGIESDEGMAHVRLATALAECGRLREAVPHYRRAVELLPNYNPGIIGLAQAYRKLGQWEEAARAFDQALRNNPYDPTASSALAEFELSSGQVVSATGRLERLLDWMPEHAVAHANLGVCYSRLGRHREAERECRRALALDATLVPPRLALAMRLARCGVMQEAGFHFGMAAEQSGYADIEVLLPYSDFLIAQADLPAAAALWAKGLEQRPNDPTMAGWYAWVCVLAERWELAWRVGEAASQVEDRGVGAALAGIMLDVHADRPERAAAAVGGLCADNSPGGNQAHDRLQQALKAYSSRHANNPWPYYLMIIMFDAQGRADAARLALEAFEQVCTDPQWIRRARSLRANATSQPTKNGGRMEEMENEK